MTDSSDRVLRAITDSDTFRVMVATTSDTVRRALATQRPKGSAADHFAHLLTGAVLMRETMAPDYRVQAILRGRGGSLLADAHPDGMTRGLVQLRGDEPFALAVGSSLEMMRRGARGQLYRSVVRPREGATVPDALMTYLQESEQIVSVIGAGIHRDGGEVEHAGGYVIQLLPGAARGPLMIMTERLEALPPIGQLLHDLGGDAQALLEELLYGLPHAQLDRRPVYHGCNCSEEAVLASLGTLPRAELEELSQSDEVLEISCDYCHESYRVLPRRLAGLLDPS